MGCSSESNRADVVMGIGYIAELGSDLNREFFALTLEEVCGWTNYPSSFVEV